MARSICLALIALGLMVASINAGVLVKRQIGFTGGFSPASIDDETIRKMADFATTEIIGNTKTGVNGFVKLVKAETQVVAGTNYKLTMEMSGATAAGNRLCEAVVFNQPWTGTIKLIRSECSPIGDATRKTRQPSDAETAAVAPAEPPRTVGGYSPADVKSDEVIQMADFATEILSKRSNSGPYKRVEIVTAETQVVAGTNYKMTLKFSDSSDAAPFTCDVVVFDQPWSNTREVIESLCPTKTPAKVSITPA